MIFGLFSAIFSVLARLIKSFSGDSFLVSTLYKISLISSAQRFLKAPAISLWYFFSSQALVKVLGTQIIARPFSREEIKEFLNQVVKLALDKLNSISPKIACQSCSLFIAWGSYDLNFKLEEVF